MDISVDPPTINDTELHYVLEALTYEVQPLDIKCPECDAEPNVECDYDRAPWHRCRERRADGIDVHQWFEELIDALDEHDIKIRDYINLEVKAIFNRQGKTIG